MSYDTIKQSVLFENPSKKTVVAKFDQDHASSDGGTVLLMACDEKLKLSETLAAKAIACHRRCKKRVKRITIDLALTDEPTHGGQRLTFFNQFYDTSCYLLLAGFLAFDDEVEQYLFCYVLCAGNAAAKHGAIGVLKRLPPRLCWAFPKARPRIRLDGGFSGPELYEFFEAEKLDYVVGMARNPKLQALAEPLFFWPDSLNELHCATVGAQALAKQRGFAT